MVYNFTATDQLSPVLQAQAQALQQLAASSTLVQQSLNGVLALSQQLANAQQQTTAALSQVVAGLGQTTAALTTHTTAQGQAAAAVAQTGTALQAAFAVAGGIGIATSIRQVVGELREFVSASVQLAARRESLVASFRGVTGSAGAARDQLRFLREEATRTSSDFDTLASSYRNITAASRGTRIEGAATQTVFQGIIEAGRVLGLSQAEVGRALLAVEQIISKGKVSQEELRRQLGNALPGAAQIAARAFGVTTEELNKMVKEGISAEEFIARFGPQLRREFGPGLAAAAQTASATFARLGNEIKDISAGIGSEILKLLQPAASALDTFLRRTREARTQESDASADEVGGVPEGATDDEAAQIRRLGRLRRINANNAGVRQGAEEQAQQIRAGILARAAQAGRQQAANEDPGGQPGQTPFASQLAQVKQARQEVEQELALIQSVEKNAPQIFAGTGGELERQGARLVVIRAGLEAIAAIVAKTPGLAKELTPEFQAQFDALNKQYGLTLRLQEAAQARIDAEKQAERDRERAARQAEQNAEKAARDRETAIEQLGRLSGQLDFPTSEKATSGIADQAATIEARFPKDEQIQRQTEELRLRLEVRQALNDEVSASQDLFVGLKQQADATREASDAQEDFNKKLADAIALARAPREERPELRLRALAPGGVVTSDQESQLTLLTQIQRQRAHARAIEDIYRDLGRGIEQTLSSALDQAFTGGITSGRQAALLIAQGFARVASQLLTSLLTTFAEQASGAAAGSGLGGVLSAVVKIGLGLVAGSVGGSSGGSGAGASAGAGGQGFGSVFTSSAEGRVVTRPQLSLIGDDRAGFGEAVIPLSRNRAVPVEMRGGGRSQEPQTIMLQLVVNNDFKGSIDPRALRTTPPEIVSAIVKDISQDGVTRRIIMERAR